MTTLALNNLWNYLQGLALSKSDREWLANNLLSNTSTDKSLAEERKKQFLQMAGSWANSAESEEYYQMLKHRNDGRPANRDISSFDK